MVDTPANVIEELRVVVVRPSFCHKFMTAALSLSRINL